MQEVQQCKVAVNIFVLLQQLPVSAHGFVFRGFPAVYKKMMIPVMVL